MDLSETYLSKGKNCNFEKFDAVKDHIAEKIACLMHIHTIEQYSLFTFAIVLQILLLKLLTPPEL